MGIDHIHRYILILTQTIKNRFQEAGDRVQEPGDKMQVTTAIFGALAEKVQWIHALCFRRVQYLLSLLLF